jgi:ParB-like chromosome segregation protein Spo0J
MNFPDYKTVAIDSLIPYARNSRTHSASQIDKIAASIREFGFLNPIIIDGQNGIIAGHGRVMAAKKLNLESLPVIEASHLTDAQRRAYIIADNRLALDAGWDNELLRIELQDLDAQGFNLSLTDFEVEEMSALFGNAVENESLDPEISDHQNQMIVQFEDEATLEEWFNKLDSMDGIKCKIL